MLARLTTDSDLTGVVMSKIKLHGTTLAFLLGLVAAFSQATAAREGTTDNLLVNGDAELHRCTDDWTAQTPVPGWRVLRGAASVLCYSAFSAARETPQLPANAAAGKALFAAPGADTAMEQIVNVSAASAVIDNGDVNFTLSGWLGGWRDRPERATLTAVFLDEAGHGTGSPVVIADAGAEARANTTGLLARHANGSVPRLTRQIIVTVNFMSGANSYHNAYADNISLKLRADHSDLHGLAAADSAPPATNIPGLDHVYVVMMENTNYSDVMHATGRSVTIDPRMPFLGSLAKNGVVLTNMWGNYHPSDQNYVAMVAGDTYRYGPVYFPDYNLPVTHLGDLLDAKSKSWRAYVQNMKTPCNLSNDQGYYAPDDQPFVHFQNVVGDPARCAKTARDLNDFAAAIATKTLPNFAWIAADGWWDGEMAWWDNFSIGDSLNAQDAFLKSTFGALVNSAQWRKSRSLLIVTWDESLGWGWPDNRVPTILIGSPGLLRAGAVVDEHYDGYSVLRTIEAGFGLDNLGRFDQFAEPLNAAFASNKETGVHTTAGDLWPADDAATRGDINDTFGRVTTPAAVVRGKTLKLVIADNRDHDAIVNVEPLGQVPTTAAKPYRVDDETGAVSIPTDSLQPGVYGAWLRRGTEPPHRAPLLVSILPRALVSPDAPGVEIVGASGSDQSNGPITVREASNLIVRYCRPAGTAPGDTWIGIFAAGTPSEQMTKDNANVLGFWLKTPGGENGQACGEAMAFAAELATAQDYQVFLLRDDANGASTAVGRSAAFNLTPALP
jgi:hypothetical protein